jgi:hypothetical protein
MDIRQAAKAAWVPDFVRVSNLMSGIFRDPTKEEVAAHRGLFAASPLRVENLEMFVAHVAGGARLRPAVDVAVTDQGEIVRIDPRADLDIILRAAHISAAAPQRLHRLFTLLHPFTDGNARAARAFFLWQKLSQEKHGGGAIFGSGVNRVPQMMIPQGPGQRIN